MASPGIPTADTLSTTVGLFAVFLAKAENTAGLPPGTATVATGIPAPSSTVASVDDDDVAGEQPVDTTAAHNVVTMSLRMDAVTITAGSYYPSWTSVACPA